LGPLSIKLFFSYCDAICDSTTDARHSKGSRHEQTRNDANNVFRPSDSPLTEYEKEQIALRKNLERLKAERLASPALALSVSLLGSIAALKCTIKL